MNPKMLNALFVMLLALVKGLHKDILYELENKVCINCKKIVNKEIRDCIESKKLNETTTGYIKTLKGALSMSDLDICNEDIYAAGEFLDIYIKPWSWWDLWPF